MKITDHITINNIYMDIAETDKTECIREMSKRMAQEFDNIDLFTAIMDKEMKRGTGFPNGIAFPRGLNSLLREIVCSVAILRHGVDWEIEQPVKLIFMVAAPRRLFKSYFNLIVEIIKIATNESNRQSLLGCSTAEEAYIFLSSL